MRAMVSEGFAATTDLVAYPVEIVTDMQGDFLGFTMRHVSNHRPLHELYSPKSRQRHFPSANYRFLVRAAQNVASAVGTVHLTGRVIGDLNHSGVLVAQDATVALIDADSFQFNLNGKLYPCEVGVPEFTPPEMQGRDLASVRRTIAHDNFGLAVAIFYLLFMGCHPYAGRYTGPDISIGKAIAQNRFAFSLARAYETGSSPPLGALTLDKFPDEIIRSFEAAFASTNAARPSAQDWIHTLRELEGNLNRCSNSIMHHYPSSTGSCVWCELEPINNFDMFPTVSKTTPTIPAETHIRGIENYQKYCEYTQECKWDQIFRLNNCEIENFQAKEELDDLPNYLETGEVVFAFVSGILQDFGIKNWAVALTSERILCLDRAVFSSQMYTKSFHLSEVNTISASTGWMTGSVKINLKYHPEIEIVTNAKEHVSVFEDQTRKLLRAWNEGRHNGDPGGDPGGGSGGKDGDPTVAGCGCLVVLVVLGVIAWLVLGG